MEKMRKAKNGRFVLFAAALWLSWLVLDGPVQGEELSSYQRELAKISQRLQELFKERAFEKAGGPKMTEAKKKELESLVGRRSFIDPLWRLQAQLLEDVNALGVVVMDDEKERARLTEFYREAAKLIVELERPSTFEAAERLAHRLRVALARRDLPSARREAAQKEGDSQ